jgi:hypothetical protein
VLNFKVVARHCGSNPFSDSAGGLKSLQKQKTANVRRTLGQVAQKN